MMTLFIVAKVFKILGTSAKLSLLPAAVLPLALPGPCPWAQAGANPVGAQN